MYTHVQAEMGYDRADEIITIDKSAQMLETLRLFHSEFVWSVTVTDEADGDGCLFGCISSALFRVGLLGWRCT